MVGGIVVEPQPPLAPPYQGGESSWCYFAELLRNLETEFSAGLDFATGLRSLRQNDAMGSACHCRGRNAAHFEARLLDIAPSFRDRLADKSGAQVRSRLLAK